MNFARIINNWTDTKLTRTSANSTNIKRSNLDSLPFQELTEEEMAAVNSAGGLAFPDVGKQGSLLGLLFG